MTKRRISIFDENDFFFFFVASKSDFVLKKKNFACDFAKMSYLQNLVTYMSSNECFYALLIISLFGIQGSVISSTICWSKCCHDYDHPFTDRQSDDTSLSPHFLFWVLQSTYRVKLWQKTNMSRYLTMVYDTIQISLFTDPVGSKVIYKQILPIRKFANNVKSI